MKAAGLVVVVASLLPFPSLALDSRLAQGLRQLDPATRHEQVCDAEAMARIGKDRNPYRPDRALTGAVRAAKVTGTVLEGTGGAFRSGKEWYRFSFTCRTTPDHMQVLSFAYKIGEKIPESEWEEYGLWR
jgi:hypothetical protein